MNEQSFLEYQQGLEASLLSHIRKNPKAGAGLTLDLADFSTPERGQLYRIVRDLGAMGVFEFKAIQHEASNRAVTLEPNWTGLFNYALKEEGGDFNTIQYYARKLQDYRLRREYIAWFDRQRDTPHDLQVPMEEVIRLHSQQIAQIQEGLTQDIDPSVAAIVERSLTSDPNPYFPSGLDAIDQKVHGLRKGHQWVISAPYKGRKTSTVLNIVEKQLRAGKSVMYVALEDDDRAFLHKLAAIWGDIPHEIVEEHTTTGREPVERVQRALDEIRETKLRIYDARKGVHRWKNFEALVAGDKLRFGELDVVVVDYAQAWSTSYDVLQEIVPMLLRVTTEKQVAMIVLSQMNNDAIKTQHGGNLEGSAGMLSTKGTGDFGATCHVGIEIGRNLEIDNELTLTIKAARNGKPGQTWVNFNADSGHFYANTLAPSLNPGMSNLTRAEREEAIAAALG